jgi:hypothetical protein
MVVVFSLCFIFKFVLFFPHFASPRHLLQHGWPRPAPDPRPPEELPKKCPDRRCKGSPPVKKRSPPHPRSSPCAHPPDLKTLPTCQSRQKSPREIFRAGLKLRRQHGRLALGFIPIRPACPWPPYWVCPRAPLTRRRECRQAKHRNRPSHIGRSLPSPRRLQAP